MNNSNIEYDGILLLKGKKHNIEYEPGAQEGAKTLFLCLSGGYNIPIFYTQIDEVIEMLRRGKELIKTIEIDTYEVSN